MQIIDSHIHCGVQNVAQPFGEIAALLEAAGINGSCLFAPVEDIYDRYVPDFDDGAAWRRCRERAHAYLLDVAAYNEGFYPYYFVWNDFTVEDLAKPFCGIKWHHHPGEPAYRYDDPRCTEMIDAVCAQRLPVVLEETFAQTLRFVERVAGRTAVIIPHLGLLNGGFDRLLAAGIWEAPNLYADTALAGRQAITTFLERYGADRLIFGSDYPFGLPGPQLRDLRRMDIPPVELQKICAGTIQTLLPNPRRRGDTGSET